MRSVSILLTTSALLFGVSPLNAQFKHLQSFPPNQISKEANEAKVTSLKWSLEQKKGLLKKLDNKRRVIRREISTEDANIAQIKNDLDHTHLVDQSTRSRLAGKMMEEMLDACLELAAIEHSAGVELDQDQVHSKVQELKVKQLQSAVSMAKTKAGLANEDHERAKFLVKKGSITVRELKHKQFALLALETELANAVTELEIEQLREKSQKAEAQTHVRLKSAPLQARKEYAANMLEQYKKTDEIIAVIDRREGEKKLLVSQLEAINQQILTISAEVMQLENLTELIEKRVADGDYRKQNPRFMREAVNGKEKAVPPATPPEKQHETE